MARRPRPTARYRLALRNQLVLHRHAVYEALCLHEHGCLSNQLAIFMLSEAGWSQEDFVWEYLGGELGG